MSTERPNNGKSEGSLAALAEHRAATQFGGERSNPRSHDNPDSRKPWSTRNALRRFAKLDVDLNDPSSFIKALPKKMSMAEYMAAQAMIRACKLGRDFQIVLEQIDGKLATTNINADVSVIMSMSDDELIKLATQPLTITDASYREVRAGEAFQSARDDEGEAERII